MTIFSWKVCVLLLSPAGSVKTQSDVTISARAATIFCCGLARAAEFATKNCRFIPANKISHVLASIINQANGYP